MTVVVKGGPGSGDKVGHEFHGNQHTGPGGASEAPDISVDKKTYAEEGKKISFNDESAYKRYRQREKAWDAAARIAVSKGEMDPAVAEKRGLDVSGGGKWEELPAEMWHVTTAKDAVLESGKLKTRSELQQDDGHGLGGGPSDTISFTTSKEIAIDIKDAMLEARKVAAGEITMDDLLKQAREGTGASRPFLDNIVRFYRHNWKPGDDLPDAMVADLEGKLVKSHLTRPIKESELTPEIKPIGEGYLDATGERRWHRWMMPNPDKDDADRRKFDLYKTFIAMREHAGGRMNPLFFNSDSKALGLIRPDQIAIIRVKPKPRSRGLRVSGLSEVRTFTGEITDIDGVE